MSVSEFYALLNDPSKLKGIDKSVLEQWIRQYPYFQTAYILAAKKSHLDHESTFENKLGLAAAYAADRLKLFELINAVSTEVPAVVETTDQFQHVIPPADDSLDDLLRSIHERKKQILFEDEEIKMVEEQIALDAELLAIDELSSAGSEFLPLTEQEDEHEESDNAEGLSSELEMMKQMDRRLNEQGSYESMEELLLLNEMGGGGSEYLPYEDLLDEESDLPLVEEIDPELASMSVLEEEFILHDIDLDIKEKEMQHLSEARSFLQIEQEDKEPMEFPTDAGLQAVRQMEEEWRAEDEYNKHEELLMVNETGGGGSEFTMIEMDEEDVERESISFISESDALFVLEDTISGSSKNPEPETIADESTLRFNEHVESPGAFLPEKSYTFLEWLRFFKPEPSAKKVVQEEEVNSPVKVASPEPDPNGISNGFREELETIDKMVSVIHPGHALKPGQFISTAELARKSIQQDDELVSETLAKIYEEQGLIDKGHPSICKT
jgi:hypothetical protein